MKKTHKALILAAISIVVAGCRSEKRSAATPDERIATLERNLEGQRKAETLVTDVEGWIDRARAGALPSERERVEALATDLRLRLERVKPSVGRQGGERTGEGTMAGDLAELRNAYDRAMASIGSERKTAEEAMAETLTGIDGSLKEFRLEISSAGVQTNAEVKRRLAALELGRREAADTLADLRHAGVDNWAALHRRWETQIHAWNEDFQEANERLKRVPTPVPLPSPKITPRKGKSE